MEKATEKPKFKFHESKAYTGFFKAYMSWCKEKGANPLTKDPTTIVNYLKDLKAGYPKNETPRKVQTLKIKLTAIKRHYELNNIADKIDFKQFNATFFENL